MWALCATSGSSAARLAGGRTALVRSVLKLISMEAWAFVFTAILGLDPMLVSLPTACAIIRAPILESSGRLRLRVPGGWLAAIVLLSLGQTPDWCVAKLPGGFKS